MSIKKGALKASPIIMGYIPVGIAFGLVAANSDVPLIVAIALSAIVYTGASQFMAVNALVMGIPMAQIIMATFIMNMRHFVMSASVVSRVKPESKPYRPLIAFWVTDESYALTSLDKELDHKLLLVIQATSYLSWNIATVIGFFVGNLLPPLLQASMGITLYVLFATLLIPAIKKEKMPLMVAVCAGAINTLLEVFGLLDSGWNLIIAMLSASMFGYIMSIKKAQGGGEIDTESI